MDEPMLHEVTAVSSVQASNVLMEGKEDREEEENEEDFDVATLLSDGSPVKGLRAKVPERSAFVGISQFKIRLLSF